MGTVFDVDESEGAAPMLHLRDLVFLCLNESQRSHDPTKTTNFGQNNADLKHLGLTHWCVIFCKALWICSTVIIASMASRRIGVTMLYRFVRGP